ncbi:hypothetical protein PA6761_05166 [Pseudomonas aeruginosa]
MSDPLAPRPPLTGLILSGGGARAAYQVGVLAAIADLLPDSAGNPFPVIVGTSAGAINAVGLACGALQFRQAIQRLTAVWQGFRTEHVYRSDWPGVTRQASRFLGHSLLGLGGGCRWRCWTTGRCMSCWHVSWIFPGFMRRCASASCARWR